ncbi:MAG: ABC transporter ATP-binding protein [Deltaproteobacteria bacterium]|nr:ABC transporter ATP-binding protein [Deltaproteobacteria bacterium]
MELITLKGLYKSYGRAGTEVEVLNGIDLSLKKGETAAVVGASGVGKSTLLNIMGALDRPSKGTVLYNGRPITGLDDRKLASLRNKSIGFVFQFHHLLPEFTALENVMLPALIGGAGPREAKEKAEALLKEVGLGQRLGHKPGELSGGEQQRAAIVRAIIQSPEAVLADEPTGNLDTKTADEVFEVLLHLNRAGGAALVVVTHNERLASRMSRRLNMVDGRIYEG